MLHSPLHIYYEGERMTIRRTIGIVFVVSFVLLATVLTKKQSSTVQKMEQGKKMSLKVETTASGLKYQTLQPASDENAASPTKGQMVHVHYTGWLADANGEPNLEKKFDSSVDRGQPFSFPVGVGMVIQGWEEGIRAMKVGEKCRLTIPSNLGYGQHGAGNVIPPNADLVFDVELLRLG